MPLHTYEKEQIQKVVIPWNPDHAFTANAAVERHGHSAKELGSFQTDRTKAEMSCNTTEQLQRETLASEK